MLWDFQSNSSPQPCLQPEWTCHGSSSTQPAELCWFMLILFQIWQFDIWNSREGEPYPQPSATNDLPRTFQWDLSMTFSRSNRSSANLLGTSSGSTPALIIAVLIHRDTPSPWKRDRLCRLNADLHKTKWQTYADTKWHIAFCKLHCLFQNMQSPIPLKYRLINTAGFVSTDFIGFSTGAFLKYPDMGYEKTTTKKIM